MLRFYADKFVACINSLQMLEVLARDPEYIYDKPKMGFIHNSVQELIVILTELNLPVSLKKAKTLQVTMTMEPHNKQGAAVVVKDAAEELRKRIEDELDGRVFYSIADNTRYLTDAVPLFGKEVDLAFPKTTEDVSEAGKCFALGRSTATVFHLMRAMEICVQTLYLKLGLTGNIERVWGMLLSDMHTAIEAMPKGDRRNDWSASHSNLYHVKQAWRNDSMHPKQTYTPEEAKEIFDAVRSFMRHLAGLV